MGSDVFEGDAFDVIRIAAESAYDDMTFVVMQTPTAGIVWSIIDLNASAFRRMCVVATCFEERVYDGIKHVCTKSILDDEGPMDLTCPLALLLMTKRPRNDDGSLHHFDVRILAAHGLDSYDGLLLGPGPDAFGSVLYAGMLVRFVQPCYTSNGIGIEAGMIGMVKDFGAWYAEPAYVPHLAIELPDGMTVDMVGASAAFMLEPVT